MGKTAAQAAPVRVRVVGVLFVLAGSINLLAAASLGATVIRQHLMEAIVSGVLVIAGLGLALGYRAFWLPTLVLSFAGLLMGAWYGIPVGSITEPFLRLIALMLVLASSMSVIALVSPVSFRWARGGVRVVN